ncbi:uncharacterized protein N7511_001796 [Penicillium nucicola]|uniref:uncharacterized protein n=1 Tax=Penicillium nucicola TaxID=1850975 RepID=UPI002544E0AC|nr:uncharacterized protein N7511_001796 [Penicillium nucicola]KAJ5769745.1 hypothetical protein N7511_001796 [Penicillium nucicola]
MSQGRHHILSHQDTLALTVESIQSQISGLIFVTFWVRFMVGYEASWNNYLWDLDKQVRDISIASQEALNLQNQQQKIVDQVEEWFADYSITDTLQRASQLSDLIQRCVQLKQNLECQEGIYIFRRSHPRMPYRDEKMRILIEEVGLDETIDYSVWPGLYKIQQPGNWVVIEKEIVKISAATDIVSITDDSEGQTEDQLLEL